MAIAEEQKNKSSDSVVVVLMPSEMLAETILHARKPRLAKLNQMAHQTNAFT